MASQSFNVIGQEEEQELVAFETRQSRGPTPQSRPSSRMEELFSQMFRSLESKLVENTRSLAENTRPLESKLVENTRSLESKLVENTRSLAENTRSIENKITDMAYKQVEQIKEMSDLVDRILTVERSLQGCPVTGSDPTRRSLTSPGHAWMASAPYPLASTTPS